MILSRRLQAIFLLMGDWILLYTGFFLTLMIRYQNFLPPTLWKDTAIWDLHKGPFFFIHLLWILVFYISGLYDVRTYVSFKSIFSHLFRTMAVGGVLAILIFYLVPNFNITPKTNLLIDIALVTVFLTLWRRLFWVISHKTSKIKVLFFGVSKEIKEFIQALKKHPQIGYAPSVLMNNPASFSEINIPGIVTIPIDHNLIKTINEHNIQLIVASREIMHEENAAKRFYETLPLGVSITDFPAFYETIMEKVPISMITETWFLENLFEIKKKAFEFFKRAFDITFAVILGTLTIIFILPIFCVLIKLNSPGPIFYRQKRTGKNGRVLELAKLRSMIKEAEKDGAKWAGENDKRITKIGKFIRKTRVDELPQLWNVLKGELSFIGPRPERPEFVEKLQKEIPYYAMRHLVKPGLSGWAQIKLSHGGVGEESMEKLQYDLFYIKNRSFALDLAIALKTLATILKMGGR